ncbi:hypothetical protein [Ralstonia pseudosolanacearum]
MRLFLTILIVVAVFLLGLIVANYFEFSSILAVALSSFVSYMVLRQIAGPADFKIKWRGFNRKFNVDHLLNELDDPRDKLVVEKVAGFLVDFYDVDVTHLRLDDDLWIRGFRPQGMLPQVTSVHAMILRRRLGVRLRLKEYESMRTMHQFIDLARKSRK